MKSPAEFIVAGDVFYIRVETERLKHARVYTERNSRVALLDAAQGLSRYTGPLRDVFGSRCATQPGLSQPFPETGKLALKAGEKWRCGARHNG